jgi:hypothetical protein
MNANRIFGPREISEVRQNKLNWALVDAVDARKWAKAKELLDCGANPNCRNAWGFPILIAIASSGPKTLLEKAIEKGGDGEIQAPVNSWTPIKAATVAGNTEAVRAFRRAKGESEAPTGF